jgi:uncharacterized protein (DUF3820 family)
MSKLAYEDDDLLDFGKYKNLRLMDVPASYLHWIYTNNIQPKNFKLHNYIENNIMALKEENKDLIWTK